MLSQRDLYGFGNHSTNVGLRMINANNTLYLASYSDAKTFRVCLRDFEYRYELDGWISPDVMWLAHVFVFVFYNCWFFVYAVQVRTSFAIERLCGVR